LPGAGIRKDRSKEASYTCPTSLIALAEEENMDRATFSFVLSEEGFSEVVTVEREPNGKMETHTHPFEAKALILRGEITIRTAESERVYRPGDVFHLAGNQEHDERYGPEGVVYLAGRR
jgi:quercetin dioxygenase-like cupin family protein